MAKSATIVTPNHIYISNALSVENAKQVSAFVVNQEFYGLKSFPLELVIHVTEYAAPNRLWLAAFLALGTQTVGNAPRIVKEPLAIPAAHQLRFLSAACAFGISCYISRIKSIVVTGVCFYGSVRRTKRWCFSVCDHISWAERIYLTEL